MSAKVEAEGGAAAMAMVAKGDVDFGATFLSEMTDPGITILGPLPASIAPPTLEVAFVSAHTAHTQTAKDLIAFLSSAKAAEAYKAFHMIPLH